MKIYILILSLFISCSCSAFADSRTELLESLDMVDTGRETDLAIAGDGFFLVKDKVTNRFLITRKGNFRIDDRGYVITEEGYRLQGYKHDLDYCLPKYAVTLDSDANLVYTRMPILIEPKADEITDVHICFSFDIDNSGNGLGGTLEVAPEVYEAGYDNVQIKTVAPALDWYGFDTEGNFTYMLSDSVAFSPYKVALLGRVWSLPFPAIIPRALEVQFAEN